MSAREARIKTGAMETITAEEQSAAKDAIARLGIEHFKCSDRALFRAVAGQPVNAGTAALIRQGLAAMKGEAT